MADKAVTSREDLVTATRIQEIELDPVPGKYNADHLRAFHARIFQDLPHHGPGEYRPHAEGHVKARELEAGLKYEVPYANRRETGKRLDAALKPNTLAAFKAMDQKQFVTNMAKLYADLDYAHPFKEGNSRTLRAFTRQLAKESGHELDWRAMTPQGKESQGRDLLYLARDNEVFKRHYPGIEKPGYEPPDRTANEAISIVAAAGKQYPTLEQVVAKSAERKQPEKAAGREPDIDIDR